MVVQHLVAITFSWATAMTFWFITIWIFTHNSQVQYSSIGHELTDFKDLKNEDIIKNTVPRRKKCALLIETSDECVTVVGKQKLTAQHSNTYKFTIVRDGHLNRSVWNMETSDISETSLIVPNLIWSVYLFLFSRPRKSSFPIANLHCLKNSAQQCNIAILQCSY